MMNVGSFMMTKTASLCPSPAHFPSVWAHGHSLWPPHLFFLPTWVGLGPSRAPIPPWTLSSSGCYSLSIRLSRPASWDRIRHYRIQRLDNGWLYISPRLTFPSLQALVDHYSGTALPRLCEKTGLWGLGGADSVPLRYFTCSRISRQMEEGPPLSSCQSLCQETQAGSRLHPMP